METPKFLRKYKLVIKYVVGFIAMMYLISTYLISSESTFCCIMLATIAVLVVTLISENINRLKSLFK